MQCVGVDRGRAGAEQVVCRVGAETVDDQRGEMRDAASVEHAVGGGDLLAYFIDGAEGACGGGELVGGDGQLGVGWEARGQDPGVERRRRTRTRILVTGVLWLIGVRCARRILAAWIGDAGDPARARDLLTELLRVRERVSGAEHPDTLLELGHWTGRAGDIARVLGAHHPDPLNARRELANWTQQASTPAKPGHP